MAMHDHSMGPPTSGASSAGDMSTGGESMSMSMDNMMHMTFYWGKTATILLSNWTTGTVGQYIGALMAVVVFCVLHEILTTLRVIFVSSSIKLAPPQSASESTSVPLVEQWTGPTTPLNKAMGAMLYGLNAASSYVIMLIIMTFNVGLFLAVVFGLSLGYFLFGYGRSSVATNTSADVCCPA